MARKQTNIPGTEHKLDPELSKAAEDLHEVRSERMSLTKQEADLAERLIGIMERKGVEVYADPELEIRVTLKPGKSKVSVTAFHPESAED